MQKKYSISCIVSFHTSHENWHWLWQGFGVRFQGYATEGEIELSEKNNGAASSKFVHFSNYGSCEVKTTFLTNELYSPDQEENVRGKLRQVKI